MKLYTKTVCPRCLWVKSEFKQAGIEVEIVNIDKDESEKETVSAQGFTTVPVLFDKGEWYGTVDEIFAHIGRKK